jgi:SH3-like domain-containing protein
MKLIGNLIIAILLCIPQIAGGVCIQGDCINGHGTAVLPDGSRYVGEFREGVRSGRGSMTYPDGTKYVGDWLHDEPNGKGTLISIDRFEYTGEFVNGVRQGQGTLETADGKKYEGQWRNDAPHGGGKFINPGKEEFVGHFENGQRSGQGEATYTDGTRYKGQWADDLPNGQGIKTLTDGMQYSGNFKNGLMFGSGTIVLPDGSQFKIQWQNDTPREKEVKEPGAQSPGKEEQKDWYMLSSLKEVRGRHSRESRESASHVEVSAQELGSSPEPVPPPEPEVAVESVLDVSPQPPEDDKSVMKEQAQPVEADNMIPAIKEAEVTVESAVNVSPQPPEDEDSTMKEQAQPVEADNMIPGVKEAQQEAPEAVMPVKGEDEPVSRTGYALYYKTANGVQYARIAKGANVRSGPSLTSEVLRTVPAGYPVVVLEQQEDWSLVQDFRQRKGWVYEPLIAEPETVIIKVYKGNLRRGPSLTDDVIVQLDYGTVVSVAETRGDWLRVSDPENGTGWLHRKVIWP